MRGIASDVVGTASPTSSMNMEKVRKTVSAGPIFSCELQGRQNVSNVRQLSITHGTITLNV